MHWLVAGRTGAGKSRSMRERIIPGWISGRLAEDRRPRPVIALDILGQPWGATMQTRDPDEFLATLRRSKGCIGVWDECGAMCQMDRALEKRMAYLALMARNDGHLMYFMAQRLYHVPPMFRFQCTKGLLFNLVGNDVREACEVFGEPALEPALPALRVGECLVVKPMEKPIKTRFF